MTVTHEKQIPLKCHNKAGSNSEAELTLIGIELMEEMQPMARQKNVHFSLDADDGFGCMTKGDKSYLELGLKSLATIYLENCHSGNELQMKVTNTGFKLRAVYVEFPDDIVNLLNGTSFGNKKTELDIPTFRDYIAHLDGTMKTCCDESGCYTEILLQTYEAFNRNY